ncbi:acetolactate synthase I/II/III large subunit [Micromonospora qiuiae]|uniref:Acetolactate synthase I/II/III large subunit n=1 Tax=Micromonospora qiuiae TaxID=502268 RepID=A0ABQ4JH20_9ACTN|nr:thiamine pyrophosphate-dependent enzyme [Micromonospora qiuiae]GIJ28754.1 acetolactate synthase I/II/III large subunit [Micromonospora qiuiae]
MNVGEHLVAKLIEEGVNVVFTVPGEQHDAIFGALAGTGIRVVHTRHEQAAALMAYGYARSSQRVGAYLVISGPGVLNSATGLATAYAGDARVLCIATQIPTPVLGRNLGIPHEIPDQLGTLRSLTGWAARVEEPDAITSVLDEAFHRLNHHRPRPVAIEIPTDVLAAQVTSPRPWAAPPPPASPDPRAVEAARAALATARAPIIFVGSGARGATAEIAQLAKLLKAPVTTELGGRGVVSDEHQLSISLPVAHRLWRQADVVVAVGTRLLRPQVEWGTEGLQIIRVDLDEEEIHRVSSPAVPLVGDAAEVVRTLLDGLLPAQERQEWLAAVAEARRDVDAEISKLTPQVDFIRAMRAALPEDGFFVDEMTQVGYVARLAFPVLRPSTYVLPTYVGALGFGFAASLGVKIAHPDRAVLSISGDGGFLFTAAELATAVQHGIGVVAVIFDDGSYANVKRAQRRFMPSTIATELHNPDFVKLAEAFGAVGVRANSPEELRTEIEKGFARSQIPTVIEVPVGDMANPWSWIRLPRVR